MKHWDLPFSVWISELEKELFSAHPVTLEEELILACPFTMNFLQLNKRLDLGPFLDLLLGHLLGDLSWVPVDASHQGMTGRERYFKCNFGQGNHQVDLLSP